MHCGVAQRREEIELTIAISSRCAWCLHSHQAASAIVPKHRRGDAEPVPKNGDFSICVYCGRFSIFDKGTIGGLRKPTPAEIDDLDRDPIAKVTRRAWLDAKLKLAAKGTLQ